MIITLTTDFGLRDPYVGIMKGVILGIAPDVRIVDLTHDIHAHDIQEAAFHLASAYRFFPGGTIHVAVVDPGVGSDRRAVVCSVGGHIFVGPDNGVFELVLTPEALVYDITNEELFLLPVSDTFHGRDIFAPVAAHLACGVSLLSVGPAQSARPPVRPSARPRVLHIDRFGNVITSLRREDLLSTFRIHIQGHRISRLCRAYSEANPGEVIAIEGSTGYIELALNGASAAEFLKVGRGTRIELEPTGH